MSIGTQAHVDCEAINQCYSFESLFYVNHK